MWSHASLGQHPRLFALSEGTLQERRLQAGAMYRPWGNDIHDVLAFTCSSQVNLVEGATLEHGQRLRQRRERLSFMACTRKLITAHVRYFWQI